MTDPIAGDLPAAADVATCSRGTVVVADDDTATRMMLTQILKRQHYRVIDVSNGRLACEAVAREHPDVVLLDWEMPEMDGLAALKVLKSDNVTRGIPVVMLTTQAQIEERVLAIEAGVQDFLIKPCHPRELVARIDQQRRWRNVVAIDVSSEATGRHLAIAEEQALERVRAAAELDGLRESATRDPLTGVANRLLLGDRLEQTILSSKRRKERFALLFIDLDGFKAVNDTHGHTVGDDVLKIVATRILNVVRESDTVARIGGDEFIVLAPRILKPANAAELASRLVESLRMPIRVGRTTVAVSASIGVSFYPLDACESEALLKSADGAMYASKHMGKNRFSFASDTVLTDERLWNEPLVFE